MVLDWIDEIFEEEPISNSQIAIIETLLPRVPYEESTKKEIESGLLELNYNEAYKLIMKLKDDYIPTDPQEQWKKMFKNGY